MRMRPTTTLAAFGLAAGFAFALPALETIEAQSGTPRPSGAMPDWVGTAKPGSGPVFLVRGKVGAGEDANAGYAWLAELEEFHFAWGGAVAGAQDVVFMIEAPDHGKLDALLASSPWSSVTFTVEPLVRTKDRLARGPKAAQPMPAATPEPPTKEIPSIAPARPIADPNHGDGTTHPAP
ncbi:MAG: hypothetical protein ACK5C3_14310 [bacterium]|jgi:hypothetical protein